MVVSKNQRWLYYSIFLARRLAEEIPRLLTNLFLRFTTALDVWLLLGEVDA